MLLTSLQMCLRIKSNKAINKKERTLQSECETLQRPFPNTSYTGTNTEQKM